MLVDSVFYMEYLANRMLVAERGLKIPVSNGNVRENLLRLHGFCMPPNER